MNLLDFDDIDHSPVSGWEQKYAFLYESWDNKGKKIYCFNFASEFDGRGFKQGPHTLDSTIDIHIQLAFPGFPLEKQLVWTEGMTGQEIVDGCWGVAYCRIIPRGKGTKVYGTLAYWDKFYPLTMKECKRLSNLQYSLIQAGKINRRPHLNEEEPKEYY